MKAFILSMVTLGLVAGCSQKTTMSRQIPTATPAPAQTQALPPDDVQIPSEEPQEITKETPKDGSHQVSTQDAIVAYEQQVGFQRRVIVEEKTALDKAIETRNTEVRLGRDFLNVLAYGVSTGVLSWDFLRRTGNLNTTRTWVQKRIPGVTPPAEPIRSPAVDAAVAAEAGAKTAAEGSMLKRLGSVAFKTTEAVSAAALGVVLVKEVYQTGKDINLRFSDTDEMKMHRAKLEEAERNLDAADQNLQAAILASKM